MMSYQCNTTSHTHKNKSRSTNTELIDAIQSGHLPYTTPHLYTADEQSGGRGQHGRSWLSPNGNVYLSLYVPIGSPPHLKRLSGALSLCVGLALVQMPIITAINQKRQSDNLPPIMVKWANDLGFYKDKGLFYKLAGILIEPVAKEQTCVGVVIGVGLNVTIAPHIKDGLYHAVSLSELGCTLDKTALYSPICQALWQAVVWHNKQNHLSDDFIKRFNAMHALHGKHVAVYPQNERTISHSGLCTGIDPSGALLLDDSLIFDGMAVRV